MKEIKLKISFKEGTNKIKDVIVYVNVKVIERASKDFGIILLLPKTSSEILKQGYEH